MENHMQQITNEYVEKYFVDTADQLALSWDPLITPHVENLQEELPSWLNKLKYQYHTEKPQHKDNNCQSFYMRIVGNHIEIGLSTVKFNR